MLNEQGISGNKIAQSIGRSRDAVQKYLNLGDNHGKNYYTQGNRKVRERDERQIVRLAATGDYSVREI